MILEEAYDILERYYATRFDIFHDSNCEGFDVAEVLEILQLESIIAKRYELTADDKNFLNDLLSDGHLNASVQEAVRFILGETD